MKTISLSHSFLALILISALAGFVYLPAFPGFFILDDIGQLFEHELTHKPLRALSLDPLAAISQRPMARVLFYIIFHVLGESAADFKMVGLVLHLFNGLWVFLILRLILNQAVPRESQSNLLSVIGAAVFILHPIQTSTVNYAAQSMTLLACGFLLLCLFTYLKARLAKRITSIIIWLFLAIIFSLASLLSKGVTIIFPFMLLGVEAVLDLTRKGNGWIKYIHLSVGAIAVAAFFFIDNKYFDANQINQWQYIQQQPIAWIKYLSLIFWPFNMSFHHPNTHLQGAVGVLLGASFLIGIAICWVGRKHHLILSLGALFFIAALLPESIIPLKDQIVEHRVYIPMIGFTMVIVSMLNIFLKKSPYFIYAIYVLPFFLATMTYSQNQKWKSEDALWSDVINKHPNSYRALHHFGNKALSDGDLLTAKKHFIDALQSNPSHAASLNSLATVYLEMNDVKSAKIFLDMADHLEVDNHITKLNLGYVYERLGIEESAEFNYREAARICTRCSDPHIFLGTLYFQQKKYQRAERQFEIAIKKYPLRARALFNLAKTKEQLNKPIERDEFYRQIEVIDPVYFQNSSK